MPSIHCTGAVYSHTADRNYFITTTGDGHHSLNIPSIWYAIYQIYLLPIMHHYAIMLSNTNDFNWTFYSHFSILSILRFIYVLVGNCCL